MNQAFAAVASLGLSMPAIATAQMTIYVNGACGDDSWTGSSPVCQAPDGPKRTIQGGVDAAEDDDTVIVADGVYTGPGNRDLYIGRDITVRSQTGAQTCIIDLQHEAGAVRLTAGRLDDLTIRNAQTLFGFAGVVVARRAELARCVVTGNLGEKNFGGVAASGQATVRECIITRNGGCFGAGVRVSGLATIRDCTITRNSAGAFAAGIYCDGGSPLIRDCSITGNSGDGIYCGSSSTATLRNCIIGNNRGTGITSRNASPTIIDCTIAVNAGSTAGGLAFTGGGTPTVGNCTIVGNIGIQFAGAVFVASGATVSIHDSILWGNTSPFADEIALAPASYGGGGATLTLTHCDVRGGKAAVVVGPGGTLNWGPGNIDADPLFANESADNYHLVPASPCINAGDPNFVPLLAETDIDGQMRVWGRDANGTRRVDMGSDELGSFAFGDLNCDGSFNGLDIDPFFLALGDPAAYMARFPNCDRILGDITGDGRLDGTDIDPFFECLGGGNCP